MTTNPTADASGAAAQQLAELVLSMGMVTARGIRARDLARKVLGIGRPLGGAELLPITTNGTTRWVHPDEPVFLIRAQDAVSGDAVRAWAHLAEATGASIDICNTARAHARKMDEWALKKVADLPSPAGARDDR